MVSFRIEYTKTRESLLILHAFQCIFFNEYLKGGVCVCDILYKACSVQLKCMRYSLKFEFEYFTLRLYENQSIIKSIVKYQPES